MLPYARKGIPLKPAWIARLRIGASEALINRAFSGGVLWDALFTRVCGQRRVTAFNYLVAVLLVLLAFGFLQGLARLVQFRLTLLVFQEVAFPFIVDLRNAHA